MTDLKRQRELFEAALARPIAERAQFVSAQAQGDAELLNSVRLLLAADEASGGHSAPLYAVRGVAHSLAQTQAGTHWIGRHFGPYQVTAEIGRGGMGVVLRAERVDGSFSQTVAIKLIQGLVEATARARFARERELLARLNHPNIAKLMDGGELSDGDLAFATPYLVMEFVEGLTLTAWISQRQPSLTLRLEMFRALCDAVHHAHQHLIVHRDLKPANVLIDAQNRPKLLDFGIARLVDQSIGEHVTTQRMMTLAYASPEQLRGGMASTASDVHGLGLLLFELLVGESMYNRLEARRAIESASARATHEHTDRRPSTHARQAISALIRSDAARLRGDLDHMVLKCTRTEPAERYISAAALAQDISRFLQHRPLESRRHEWRYAVWKFVRRNPLSVLTVFTSVLLLSWFAVQLKIERDRAQSAARMAQVQAGIAEQTTKYLVALFRGADPAQALGQELSARALVDRGYAQLQASLPDTAARSAYTPKDVAINSPAVRAKLFATFGEIYLEIGMPEPALAGLEQALSLLPTGEQKQLERAQILESLANAQGGANQWPQAMRSAKQALAIYELKRGPHSVEVARALIRIGICAQHDEKFDTAHALFERARGIAEALPNEQAVLAEALQYLGVWAVRTGQALLGERYLRQALAIKRKVFGDVHPSTLDSLQALSFVLGELGDIPAWERVATELSEGRKAVHGPDSSPYFQSLFARTSLLVYGLKLRQAEGTARAMVAGFAKLSAEPLFEDMLAYASLANVLDERGDVKAALEWQHRALAVLQKNQALQSSTGLKFRLRMARMKIRAGQVNAGLSEAKNLLIDLSKASADGAQSVEALDTQLLLWTYAATPMSDAQHQQAQALLAKIAVRRGAHSPILMQQALELAEHDHNPARALAELARWQPRSVAMPWIAARYALASAERRIALQPASERERAAAQALVVPFSASLRAEVLSSAPLIQRLNRLLQN